MWARLHGSAGLTWLFAGGVLIGGVAAVPSSLSVGLLGRRMATVAPAALTIERETDAPPVLVSAPVRLVLDSPASRLVTIVGRGLHPGLTLTLSNVFHVYTFGPGALDVPNSVMLRLDVGDVPDGTFDLSVRDDSGRRSNTLSVRFVRHR